MEGGGNQHREARPDLVGDNDRDESRQGNGPQISNIKIAQDDFHCKQGARKRRVEGGGNAAGRAAGQGHPDFLGTEAEKAPQRRAQGGPDARHRTFTAQRASGGDGEGGAQGLEKGETGRDVAVLQGRGLHHLGNPRPPQFGHQVGDHRPQGQATQHRRQEPQPPGGLGDLDQEICPHRPKGPLPQGD